MHSPNVEILREQDRPALVQMLEDAGDAALATAGMYRIRRAMPDVMIVAWIEDTLVGMLNASYSADFQGMRAFETFNLPRRPHAFLDRIHVHPAARRGRVGEALISTFIGMASDRACTFAGGHVDATSDATGRIAFFRKVGFEIHGNPPTFTLGLLL